MSGQLTESRFDYLIEHIDSLSDSEKAELLIAIGFNTTCNYRKQAEKLVLQLGVVSNIMGVAPDEITRISGIPVSAAKGLAINVNMARIFRPYFLGLPLLIKDINDSLAYAKYFVCKSGCEELVAVALTENDEVIDYLYWESFFIGRILTQPRLIARFLLKSRAAKVIIAHSHPSGNELPSENDKRYTQALTALLSGIDVQLSDHIIRSGKQFYSFKYSEIHEIKKFDHVMGRPIM